MDSLDNLRILGAFVLPGYIALATYEIGRGFSTKDQKDSDWARAAQSFVYGIIILIIAKLIAHPFQSHIFFYDDGIVPESKMPGFAPRLPGFALLFAIGLVLGFFLLIMRVFLVEITHKINNKFNPWLLNQLRKVGLF